MDKGVYCLVFENPDCMVRVGALGELAFRAGWHIYIGSAQGSGGLQRLRRHISFTVDCDKSPSWHIDYLLRSPCFSLLYAVYAVTSDRLECPLAHKLNGKHMNKFGCSDCSCRSHLLYRDADPRSEIMAAFHELQLHPVIKTIINPQVESII